jgi:hypothetical protein
LAAVVGGEGACGSSVEGVEEHSECEREDALGDADGEAGGSSGEVSFESHLLFQVGEDAFDHEPGRGERSLVAEVGRGSCLVRVSRVVPAAASRAL